ncbi:NAD-dependent epimerase/dehydratase family protein [Chitinophaga ginsengisegetis]|uniref:NAD-dependent epimerase/dehydratase family protein n=1 Tax=Chitinophaga ginsengisegetis TaxID=393003 RepID=UPI000DB98307|nr:NAD-dependent epimerase/dehydratase family protein [Chitinophaga ginsengisegetis]MDR6566562.1 nucleoside-diphosphate-sugar epimerase [Chitinophaga ginsengisegetis]MDR6646292.1 nucleoside-diphosphate-sugar epimerase [Chitinophaga ginsengisegetis]MDR6651115.1 nucleoside-diphosphate-sugar epimerase [Chitinophaga ginsengisegetis]
MIFVIGGSGFIGSVLGRELKKEGRNFINIDKQKSPVFNEVTKIADIRKMADIESHLHKNSDEDWVVLLAAEHRDDVSPISLYYDVNVEGTENILKVMEARGITKILFTSSVAVYGLNKNNPTEQHPEDPFNHYGKSKWGAEEVLRKWYNKDPANRTLVIIRPTVVFGPGNKGNVYNLLKQIASGKFLMIGKGENRKSMAYVENIVGFIKYCIDSGFSGYKVFNYADKPDLSMNELVKVAEQSLDKKLPAIRIPYWLGYISGIGFDILAKISGKKLPISSVRVKKFCATTQFANEAVIESGYKPIFTLEQGLDHTLTAIMHDSSK